MLQTVVNDFGWSSYTSNHLQLLACLHRVLQLTPETHFVPALNLLGEGFDLGVSSAATTRSLPVFRSTAPMLSVVLRVGIYLALFLPNVRLIGYPPR